MTKTIDTYPSIEKNRNIVTAVNMLELVLCHDA